jgi:hypothetical protein
MTEWDRKALKKQSKQTLAKWWCTLNRWQWPLGLPDPIPAGIEKPRRMEIMNWITDKLGMRAVLAEWNKLETNKAKGT